MGKCGRPSLLMNELVVDGIEIAGRVTVDSARALIATIIQRL